MKILSLLLAALIVLLSVGLYHFQQKAEEADAQITRLKREPVTLKYQISDLEQQVYILDSKLKQQMDKAKPQPVMSLKAADPQIQDHLQGENSRLLQQISELDSQNKSLEAEVKRIRDNASNERQTQQKVWEQQRIDLTIQVKDLEQKNSALQQEMKRIKQARSSETLPQQEASKQSSIDLSAQITDLEQQNNTLQLELKRSKDTHNREALDQQEASKKEGMALAAQIETLKQQNNTLQLELKRIKDTHNREALDQQEASKKEGMALAAQLDTLKQQNSTLQKKMEERLSILSKKADDEHQTRIDTLKQEKEQLAARINMLQQQNDGLQQDLDHQMSSLSQSKTEAIERLRSDYEGVVKTLKQDVEQGRIKIDQLKDQLNVTFVDQVLFPSGGVHITPSGMETLKQIAKSLKASPDKLIRVQGHTDNQQPRAMFASRHPDNWTLSSARAINVVRFLQQEGGIEASRLQAVGLADTHPIADNDSEEGRNQNRRIEIILLNPKL